MAINQIQNHKSNQIQKYIIMKGRHIFFAKIKLSNVASYFQTNVFLADYRAVCVCVRACASVCMHVCVWRQATLQSVISIWSLSPTAVWMRLSRHWTTPAEGKECTTGVYYVLCHSLMSALSIIHRHSLTHVLFESCMNSRGAVAEFLQNAFFPHLPSSTEVANPGPEM